MRFELVRREPDLAAEQARRGFLRVPAFTDVLQRAHGELAREEALAVLAAMTWGSGGGPRDAVERSLRVIR